MIEIYKDIIANHHVKEDWQDILEQMKKYNGKNYYSETKVSYAKNPIWKIIYRIIIRPILKAKYGKKKVKDKYDRVYS